MQPLPNHRAIVVGGSLAGLFTAAFLRRIGWQVEVYERSSIELIRRGVGIFATHLELFEALDKCGAGTVAIGVIAYKRITCSPSLVFGRPTRRTNALSMAATESETDKPVSIDRRLLGRTDFPMEKHGG